MAEQDKSYEDLWNEIKVEETENIDPPVTQEPPVVIEEPIITDTQAEPPVVTEEPPVVEDKAPLTVDDLDNFFNQKEEKAQKERLEKEESDRKIAEENEKLETARVERENFENESVFKDFKFDSSSILNEEDKKIVNEVEKEFPEIGKYLSVMKKQMQAEYDEKVKFLEKSTKKGLTESYSNMYDKINKEYAPILQPLQEQMQYQQQQMHEQRVNTLKQEIAKKHPDYETITPDVDKWILSQETEYQDAISKMLGSGDINKIVKVFDFYKKDNGISTANVSAQQKPVNPSVVSKKDALKGINSSNNNEQSYNNDAGSYADLWKKTQV